MDETMVMEEVVLRIQVLLKIVLERNAIHVNLNIFPSGAHGIHMLVKVRKERKARNMSHMFVMKKHLMYKMAVN